MADCQPVIGDRGQVRWWKIIARLERSELPGQPLEVASPLGSLCGQGRVGLPVQLQQQPLDVDVVVAAQWRQGLACGGELADLHELAGQGKAQSDVVGADPEQGLMVEDRHAFVGSLR